MIRSTASNDLKAHNNNIPHPKHQNFPKILLAHMVYLIYILVQHIMLAMIEHSLFVIKGVKQWPVIFSALTEIENVV